MALFEIVESPDFERTRAAIEPDIRRWDDIVAGIMFMLARSPESGPRVSRDSDLRVIETDPFPGAPDLVLYYTIDDASRVTLHWVERSPGTFEDVFGPPEYDFNR